MISDRGGTQHAAGAFGFVRGMIEHADQSRRLFRAVIGKRSGLTVQRRFREVVLDLMVEDLSDQGIGKASLGSASSFLAGALVELLLIGWVDTQTALSAVEVERTFVRMATPVLQSVARIG